MQALCCGLGSAKFNAAWGAAIETVPGSDQERARRLLAPVAGRDRRPGQDAVCASRRIRVAMQSVEDLALKDPNGAALSGLARVFTGIDARSDSATILASHNGSDGGRYTSRSPGSFVCVGVFVHGDLRHADPAELSLGGVHIDTTSWADGVATLSAEAAQQIMRMFPPFKEWFLVRPLSGRPRVVAQEAEDARQVAPLGLCPAALRQGPGRAEAGAQGELVRSGRGRWVTLANSMRYACRMAEQRPPLHPEWSWATPALDRYHSGVDSTQIDERLGLTPTERLERMRRFALSLEEATQGRWSRTSKG